MSLSDFGDARALLVVFMCNHCPFVRHILDGLIAVAKEYQGKGVAVCATREAGSAAIRSSGVLGVRHIKRTSLASSYSRAGVVRPLLNRSRG